jgi:hypothetical protein
MSISVTCPACSAKLNAPDSTAGKKVKCPKPGCGTVMLVPAPAPAFEVVEDEPPAAPPRAKPKFIPAAVADDDDEDDRPRSKRRRDDDDEDGDRPRKKKRKKGGMGAGVIAGIVLGGILVLGGLGYGIYALVGGGSKAPVPAGWVEYTSDSDKFKAYFPEKPESNSFPAGQREEGIESISMHMLDMKKSTQRMVGVIVVKFKSGSTSAERDKAMEKMRKSFAEGGDGRASEPRSVKWAGQKASEIILEDIKSPGGKKAGGVVRYFATDTHAYVAILASEAGRLKPEEENGFFDNFQLLK